MLKVIFSKRGKKKENSHITFLDGLKRSHQRAWVNIDKWRDRTNNNQPTNRLWIVRPPPPGNKKLRLIAPVESLSKLEKVTSKVRLARVSFDHRRHRRSFRVTFFFVAYLFISLYLEEKSNTCTLVTPSLTHSLGENRDNDLNSLINKPEGRTKFVAILLIIA